MTRPPVLLACVLAHLWMAAWTVAVGEEDRPAAVPVSPISTLLMAVPAEPDRAVPVNVRGVVTLAVPDRFDFAVQDEGAGMWVSALELADIEPWGDMRRSLRPGQEVEVEGVVDRGGYAPRILLRAMRVIGDAPLPEPQPADILSLIHI